MTDFTSSENGSQLRVIDALYRVANFMGEVRDLHRLLTLIMEETKAVMDSEASSCLLYDEDQDELSFEVALGEKGEGVRRIRIKGSENSFAGSCLREKQTLVVNDVQNDPRHYMKADEASQFVTRNLIATPVVFQGRLIGVLEVLNKREGVYDDADARIMEILAGQAAVAIVNARLFERSVQRERLVAMGTAVSGVAHHLKNIIQSVKGSAGVIHMGLARSDNSVIEECLPILSRGVSRMEHSVQEMLTYSKQREPELEEANLNDLIREIMEEEQSVAHAKHVALNLSLDVSIEDSFLDKFRIHDTILNLVGNAIEAHGAGGNGAYVMARTRLSRDGASHVVEIEDNGPGMPEEIATRIFDPFFSTKGSKGTGLGLAVARKVAEENGGTLSVDSEPGRGSIFQLRLPVVTSPRETAAH